jgi:hypothetical protein
LTTRPGSRDTARVKISVEQNCVESLDGRPMSFITQSGLSDAPVIYRGRVTDGKLHLETEQFGAAKKATYPFDPDIRFAWGQLLEQRRRGLTPGLTFTVKTYEPSLKVNGPVEMRITVGGKERVDVLGRQRELHRLVAVMILPSTATEEGGVGSGTGMEIESLSYVDDDARPVITTLEMGFAKVTMYQATKEEALKDADPPELFLNTFIKTNRKIEPDARRVTYRFRVPPGARGIPDLPDTAMQKVKRIDSRTVDITVSRLDWEAIRRATDEKPGPALNDYLRASSVVDIDDARIKRLSKRALRGAVGPAEKADALRKFVTDYIEHKGMDVGFATASEVARNKQGDCTEHGVLLAALARAAGLPARGVSGLVQVPGGYLDAGNQSAFGYHMWTQVYLAGQWVDIDGAMRQTDCDPTHIALAIMPLNEGGIADSLTSLLPLLGRLDIEIIQAD